jgi:hypothetical protein
MATEYVFISGKLSWVQTARPNKWDKWSVTIHPDNAGLEKVRELQGEGLKNVLSKDEDGWKVTFSRPIEVKYSGKTQAMQPPLVLDKDNKPIVDKLIGNGSDGTVKLEVYKHRVPLSDKKAKAARLAAIKVDNLVPYESKRDMSDDELKQTKGLDEVQPLF